MDDDAQGVADQAAGGEQGVVRAGQQHVDRPPRLEGGDEPSEALFERELIGGILPLQPFGLRPRRALDAQANGLQVFIHTQTGARIVSSR